ncbi:MULTISPECIES: hypothetical protein [unclassified Luteimonas]|uniref:hypothetical protein n=1 Tax=unclassified Luteimonas TaxID=2629088 RepID=UPI0016047027|nr:MULTISPECIES: hypothetical protein [unclassified Luteimonas]MBB1471419.1 hypothetical protein [Luteimonas sp. MC1782]MBB6599842.1 hypothetical protein [Luteimonas sp. MC1825]QOC87510.1 hypothetical protein IDM46_09640 [Luteimonas sp. MC1825]
MKRAAMLLVAGLAVPGMAHAAIDCASLAASNPSTSRITVLAPLAQELVAPSYLLGGNSGVLSYAYDESQTVEEVLLRQRIEGCRNVAIAVPAPSVANPDDPGAYKPKTEFDNTPWRFDMNQNGKRMTADEFDAWMKSRGVRVARGGAAAPVVEPPPPEAAEGSATPD